MTSSTGTVGLTLDVDHDGSYRIASIVPGSSADAGREIEVGDLVESIDDVFLHEPSETKTLFQSEALFNGTAGTMCKWASGNLMEGSIQHFFPGGR
jgi:C-terminal processing protease CtpA/Prc